MIISLSAFAPENFVSRDGFGSQIPVTTLSTNNEFIFRCALMSNFCTVFDLEYSQSYNMTPPLALSSLIDDFNSLLFYSLLASKEPIFPTK